MSNRSGKPPKGGAGFELKPNVTDLLDLEHRIDSLNAEEQRLKSQSGLMPVHAKKLKEIELKRSRCEWIAMSVREHVQASEVQSKIYATEKEHKRIAKAREEEFASKIAKEPQGSDWKQAARDFMAKIVAKKPSSGAAQIAESGQERE